jgi:hypothetical protein
MRIAIACSVVLGALALLPWEAAAQWAEKESADPGHCAEDSRGCRVGGRAH